MAERMRRANVATPGDRSCVFMARGLLAVRTYNLREAAPVVNSENSVRKITYAG
jgi:hypothetical protein